MIKIAAVRCRFCGVAFESALPVSRTELREKQRLKPVVDGLKRTSLTIFICGIIPCLAPFTALFGGIWFLKNKRDIKKMPPMNQVYCYVGLIASLVCTSLIVLAMIIN